MRRWKGRIRGKVEILAALEGKFFEKWTGSVGMYLFDGGFDEKLKVWDVLEGVFNESLERLGCT